MKVGGFHLVVPVLTLVALSSLLSFGVSLFFPAAGCVDELQELDELRNRVDGLEQLRHRVAVLEAGVQGLKQLDELDSIIHDVEHP